MRDPLNNLRMRMKEALDNLWARITGMVSGMEQQIADISSSAITQETDPTVPAWAKAASKPSYTAAEVGAIPVTEKGSAGGVAELDSGGKVPSAQLPSYVDDVLEYSTAGAFPATGETGKIYVATDTNLTYRWAGSGYVEIAGGLALGESSSTAYRGDRGKAAYDHAQAHGSAYAAGLYKIATNAEGHVTVAAAVAKSDITNLGIPAQDTTYNPATATSAGLMSAADKVKLDDANACATVGPSAIASFSDAYAADALNVTVDITPVQSGSGDPSPTNVRPISGWTGAMVTVSPSQNAQDGTTYDITFPTEAGTVYGGTLDVTNGTLVVDRVSTTIMPSDISNINIENANPNYHGTIYFALRIPYPIKYPTTTIGTTPFDGECSVLSPFKSGDSWLDNIARIGYWYARVESPGYAAIRCKIPGIEYTLANVQQALNGCQIVYPLATPQTYQLTPTQVALLAGTNNVWADTGGTTVAYLRADSLCINRAIDARLKGGACDHLGFYIDSSGYICQRIRSDT